MDLLENYFNKVKKEDRKKKIIAYLASIDAISKDNPNIAKAIVNEIKDQRSNLKLIASENYSSLDTQLAMGNLLTDKYSEGYVKHRFYAGCENVDDIEELAINEAKKLFNCDHVYVQPHSGADANLVAFWSILVNKIENKEIQKLSKKSALELTKEEYEKIRNLMVNQKILGLSLNSGGHLTHGYRLNISSKMMRAYSYDVDPKTEMIDYKDLEKKALEIKPLILLTGYSAYSRKLDFSILREIADSINAVLMVDMAHFAGLVAGKVFTGKYDPIPYADFVTSTTHKTLRGPRGGMVICKEEYKETVDKGCPLVLGGPMPHIMAAKAVAFKEANTKEFQDYAHQIVKNSKVLAEALIKNNIKILSNGTDNHLVLIDVFKSFNITGKQAENALRESNLTVNRNSIPNDKNGAWYTSGVRLGTAAITTLGMKEKEMEIIADIIYEILKNTTPNIVQKTNKKSLAKATVKENVLKSAKEKINNLISDFVLYPDLIID
ncbi:MAG: Serine hydroxymethyltransferase [Candidatus Anoxychlamydiales bacterium]|nr:Serine hydroxymethyltransferase [Candidatus Anoxychlamydiales bacterium]